VIAALVVIAALHPTNYQDKPLPPYCQNIRQLVQVIGPRAVSPELARRCRIVNHQED
jgi:hypothetical protein